MVAMTSRVEEVKVEKWKSVFLWHCLDEICIHLPMKK